MNHPLVGRWTVDKIRPDLLVMHVILMDILTSHGGWLRVEKEGPQMSALDACLTRSVKRTQHIWLTARMC